MKLNLNFKLKDLDGTEVEGDTMNKHIANFLKAENTNTMKFMDWAFTLWKGNVLEIDKTDMELLKRTITDTQKITNIAKYAVIEKINKAMEEK